MTSLHDVANTVSGGINSLIRGVVAIIIALVVLIGVTGVVGYNIGKDTAEKHCVVKVQ